MRAKQHKITGPLAARVRGYMLDCLASTGGDLISILEVLREPERHPKHQEPLSRERINYLNELCDDEVQRIERIIDDLNKLKRICNYQS